MSDDRAVLCLVSTFLSGAHLVVRYRKSPRSPNKATRVPRLHAACAIHFAELDRFNGLSTA